MDSKSSILRMNLIRLGRPFVKNIYQFTGEIRPDSNYSTSRIWEIALDEISGWLQRKYPLSFSSEELLSGRFDKNHHGQIIESVFLKDIGTLSIRFQHPDKDFAGRVWTADICLTRRASIGFSLRLACAAKPEDRNTFVLTRPVLIENIARKLPLHDVRRIDDAPWNIEAVEELSDFKELLTSPKRRLPVYLLTEVPEGGLPCGTGRYVVDPVSFARKTIGLAYVVTMPHVLTFSWSDEVGREWSAYKGALRTYNPGLDFNSDAPYAHPIATLNKILCWSYKERKMGEAFEEYLREQSLKYSADKRVDWENSIFVPDAKPRYAELQKSKISDQSELMELYDQEINDIKGQLIEKEDEFNQLYEMAEQHESERNTIAQENQILRNQLDQLRDAFRRKSGVSYDDLAETERPSKFKELTLWAENCLLGRLILHPRTTKGIRSAEFEDFDLVVDAMLLLANEYRNMRLSYTGAKEMFDKKLLELGLDYTPSISEVRAGEKGDTYYIQYPFTADRKVFLKHHLKKGNSREDRYSLRIYFHWDSESEQVVVGWLPNHLETRIT